VAWRYSQTEEDGRRGRPYRGKRAYEMGSDPAKTVVGEKKVVIKRAIGGGSKATLLTIKSANVTDPATGKSQKTDICTGRQKSS